MKNLLILIVVIALFLHFYPQPKVDAWYEEQKNTVLSAFSAFTDTKVRLKSDKIFTELKPHFNSFSTREVNYLKKITQSRAAVITFYQDYCENKKPSAKFHASNQKRVCNKIAQYQSLF